MKQGFSLKFSQSLSLTPQLQQAIKLLQLSAQELQEALQEQVEANPFLELQAPTAAGSVGATGALTAPSSTVDRMAAGMADAPPSEHASEASAAQADAAPSADWDDIASGNFDAPSGAPRDGNDAPDEPFSWVETAPTTLLAHLQQQARLLRCEPATAFVLESLLELLTPEGHLELDEATTAQTLAASLDVAQDAAFDAAFTAALSALHRFDPPGVGAFNVRHCLGLQLRHPCPADCVLDTKLPVFKLALRVLDEGFDLLAQRDRAGLKKLLRCEEASLAASLQLIRSLDPKPGLAFASTATEYVQPEILVLKLNNAWQARLNPAVVPALRVQETHAKFIKRGTASTEITEALQAQLTNARQLVRTVQQHFETVFRVGQAIVAAQQAFFEQGAIKLKPMVLRDIADSLGLHESTVSRVTTRKYLQTPHGVLEMKYFFSSALAGQDGEQDSSTAIKAYLLDLLKGEPPHKPLSDQALADALTAQGMNVARRTVAKYREQLGYASAHARKPL